jgi:hypothetical protein
MKQTAVEWLVEQLQYKETEGDLRTYKIIYKQANEMFEQQIIEAYDLGSFSDQQYPNPKTIIKNGKEYYNKAFKNKI